MPETNINTDFIVEEYGRIYQQRGQGLNRIKRALIQKAETLEKYATHKRLTDDIYEMANDEFQPVLQPFRVAFEPTGGVKFHPNKIVLQHIKVDLCFSPDQIIDSWLGFLEGPGVDRSQWPITRYMIEVYLKQQIDYDREVNAVYYGVRDDNGTIPSSCMDGIRKKLINGANAEYPINVIRDIGALDPTTCFDQIEAFSKKIKAIYRNVPMIICVSQDLERASSRTNVPTDSTGFTVRKISNPPWISPNRWSWDYRAWAKDAATCSHLSVATSCGVPARTN